MTDLRTLSRNDLAAIINGYEPGDVNEARKELQRRIGRILFKSAGAKRVR